MERGGLPFWFVSTHHSSDGYPNTGRVRPYHGASAWKVRDYGKIENGTESMVLDIEYRASEEQNYINTLKTEIHLYNI
jgi:hypothetical protein